MDWLTFFSRALDALAWPATIVAGILILKPALSVLLPLLSKLKYKDFELEFGRKLAEAKRDMAQALPPQGASLPNRYDQEARILSLMDISPSAGIIEAWRQVETALREAGQRHHVSVPLVRLADVAEKLHQQGVLDNNQLKIFRQLSQLRNLAVHGARGVISESDSLEFAILAEQLAAYLSSV